MPPRVRYSKDAILNAALEVVREGGMEALNARVLAVRLGCSTQPIYRELRGMEALREGVLARAAQMFSQCVQSAPAPGMPPYKATGMALLRFAHEEPQLYRLLFLRDRGSEGALLEEPRMSDATAHVYETIMQATGYTLDTARRFHTHMFIYIQGMAAMIATGYAPYDEAQNGALLSEAFAALRRLFDANGTPSP